jgi:hypothetical protein
MGQKSPAKSFKGQANLIIEFLTCLFACLIVGRVSKDVKIATLPRLFFAGPPMQTEGGDVMRAALPFSRVRCPRCQEQRSNSGQYESAGFHCGFFEHGHASVKAL